MSLNFFVLSVVIFYFGLLSFIAFFKEKPIKCFISCGHVKGVKTIEPHSLGRSKRFNGGGRLFWTLITHFCQRENDLPRENLPEFTRGNFISSFIFPRWKGHTEEVKKVEEGSICYILPTIISAGKPRANSNESRFSQHFCHTFPLFPSLPLHECFSSFRGVVGGAGDKDRACFHLVSVKFTFSYIWRSLN